MFGKYRPVKALWPELHIKDKKFMPLWAALLIALSLEFSPFVGQYLYGLLGLEAIFEEEFEDLPEIKMTVQLNQRPVTEVPPQSPTEEEEEDEISELDLEEIKNTIPLVEPRPLPNEVPSEIILVQPKVEEEDEEPALPSVFQDEKPVNKKPFPKYPREAEDNMIEGDITVSITVNEDGRVMDVQVVSANPAGVFDQEVLNKVRQWQFKRDGTMYEAEQKFIFKIDPWTKY